MKRVIVALIFFALALTICITGYLVCIEKLQDMNDSLGKAVYVAKSKDDGLITETTDDIIVKWDKYEKVLALFISHEDIEDIDDNIRILSYYAENKDYFQYKEFCEKSIIASKHAIESQKVAAKNIF